MRALEEALNAELAATNAVHAVAAIRLLAFTGCRLGEANNLKWSEVDYSLRLLHLRDSKTREKKVRLNKQAIELLKSLPRFHGNEFVFPGKRADKATSLVNHVWSRVRQRAGLPGVRLHDLRHAFASFGAAASIGLPIIGKLLGHTQSLTRNSWSVLDALHRGASGDQEDESEGG